MAQLERVTFYDESEAMHEHRELNVVKYSEIMSTHKIAAWIPPHLLQLSDSRVCHKLLGNYELDLPSSLCCSGWKAW